MRRIVWWVILIFVLLFGAAGLYNGPRDLLSSSRLGDRLLAVSVTIYGITGVISFFGLLKRRSWVMFPLLIFASAASFAGTFASIYYSPPETRFISGLAAGSSCVILMVLILIQVHREMSHY
jgi:hypothetical protein